MRIRLQKIIADAGLASRREAERWIAEGKVRVNGRVEKRLGTLADPQADLVQVGRKRIQPTGEKIYLVLNKPPSCLTTMVKDSRGRRTVMDCIKNLRMRVFPVGRLDYNTQGLLLFTNDGDLAKNLLAPKYKVERTYLVKVRGLPDEKDLDKLRRGVRLDNRPTAPIKVRVQRTSGKNCFLNLKPVEGKNRPIKRVCEKVGHPVVKLQRTHFGTLGLKDLPLEAYRFLTVREVKSLQRLITKADGPELKPR
ncbi:MAG: pseudouridine synthase [Nitrospinaceae bacterium]